MTNTKMTNAKALEYVLNEVELPEDVKEKIQNIYNSTVKKSTNRKPSKAQEQNVVYAEMVKEVLADGKARTISEILKARDEFADLSNQKMTAVVRMMIANGEVTKVVDGKKSTFVLA